MNILITGGAGYIGSHVLNLLSKQTDHNLFVYDNLSTGRKESVVAGELIEANLENLETLEHVITSKKIDAQKFCWTPKKIIERPKDFLDEKDP